MDAQTDILVAGAGAAGLATALALRGSGHSITVVGRPDVGGSSRTVALFDGSIRFLAALGVWPLVAQRAARLRIMRIVDDTRSIFPTPPAEFDAHEIGLEQFGWNIENHVLVAAMAEAVRAAPDIRLIETLATHYTFGRDDVVVETADAGSFRTRLVVAADGRRSVARRDARIGAREWSYPQAALTTILAHDLPHRDVSTEFHTRQGPCTFVPLPPAPEAPNRSSLVWLMAPEEAERRKALAPEAFAREAEQAAHSLLGELRVIASRTAYPMQGLSARAMTGPRVALVGEAAHVFPPIGAQGLNLGLRDAAHLAEAVASASAGPDPGAPSPLAAYARLRRGDVAMRSFGVDLLNRALLAHVLPVDFLRGAGLFALSKIGPLRRAAMREGVAPRFGAPRIMRPDKAYGARPPVSA